MLSIREVALHLDLSEDKVRQEIRDGYLFGVPDRPRGKAAVLEKNIVNYQEGRPQEGPFGPLSPPPGRSRAA